MSCYLVEVDAIVWLAYQLRTERGFGGWEGVAKQLAEENVASYEARYGDRVKDQTVNYVDDVMKMAAWLKGECPMPGVVDIASPYEGTPPEAWIGVIKWLRYQSCDHWSGDIVPSIYGDMIAAFVEKIAGVRDATWGGPGCDDFDEKYKR